MTEKEPNPDNLYEEMLERQREKQGADYDEWLEDNEDGLKEDFIEAYSDEFSQYCHEAYNQEKR